MPPASWRFSSKEGTTPTSFRRSECRRSSSTPAATDWCRSRPAAAGIAGAKLVVLETDNHGFGPSDPTYPEFIQAVDDFLAEDPELAELY